MSASSDLRAKLHNAAKEAKAPIRIDYTGPNMWKSVAAEPVNGLTISAQVIYKPHSMAPFSVTFHARTDDGREVIGGISNRNTFVDVALRYLSK
jgi:hypothetical protein